MQGRKEAGQKGQEASLGPPTCRAGGSLACWVWRTNKILQQSVTPGRGWDRLGPRAQASTLVSLELQQEDMGGIRPASLCGLGPVVVPLCASNATPVEHLRAPPVPSPGPGLGAGTSQTPCHQICPVLGRERWRARWADAGSFVCVLQCVLRALQDCQRPGQAPWACPGLYEPAGDRKSPTKAPGVLGRGLASPTATWAAAPELGERDVRGAGLPCQLPLPSLVTGTS